MQIAVTGGVPYMKQTINRKSLTLLSQKYNFFFTLSHTNKKTLQWNIWNAFDYSNTSVNPNESHSVYPQAQHSIGLFNLQICLFDTHHIGLKSMYALSQTHIFIFLVRWPSALGMCLTSHTWSKEPTMSISVYVENTMHT